MYRTRLHAERAHLDGLLRVRLRGQPAIARAEVGDLESHVPRLVSIHIHVICAPCQMCHCRQKQQGRILIDSSMV